MEARKSFSDCRFRSHYGKFLWNILIIIWWSKGKNIYIDKIDKYTHTHIWLCVPTIHPFIQQEHILQASTVQSGPVLATFTSFIAIKSSCMHAPLCLTLRDAVNSISPSPSVDGAFQARILSGLPFPSPIPLGGGQLLYSPRNRDLLLEPEILFRVEVLPLTSCVTLGR